jgi:hypothetical protein
MRSATLMVGLLFAAGCSGNGGGTSGSGGTTGSGSTSTSTSTGGTSGGSTGNNGTLTMTGPYNYSGPAGVGAYSVSGGSNSQIDVQFKQGADVVGFTLTIPQGAIAVQTYQPGDFLHFGMGVSEPNGIDMVTDSTDSVTLTVTSLADNIAGEQNFHGSVSATYHGTQPFPDGGSMSGSGTVDGSF